MKRTSIGNRGSGRAFTLVELLVVVSIIALLIAILMPSLRKARESAKRVACNSTIRGLALAGLTYSADDPQENGIPANASAHEKSNSIYTLFGYGGKSGIGTLSTNYYEDSGWGAKKGMGARTRPLNQAIYKGSFKEFSGWEGNDAARADAELKLEAYKCVGDRKFPGLHINGWKNNPNGTKSAYDYFGTSYACNPLWIYNPGDSPIRLKSNAMYLRPMSRVPSPGNTVMFWEAAARYAMFADNPDEYGPKASSAPGQPPSECRPYYDETYVAKGNHGDPWHFNVAFGDGHASWVKIRGYGIATGNQVPPSCGKNAQYCVCVLVRGRGWQMDTMPAPPVVSEFSQSSGSSTEIDTGEDGGENDVVK